MAQARLYGARLAAALCLVALISGCAAQGGARGPADGASRSSAQSFDVARGDAAGVGWQAYDRYDDARLGAYVGSVAARLAANADLAGPPVAVTLVEAPTPNATAGPNNEIAVTTALLALLVSEAELAWVLAHEIGHLELGHPEQLAAEPSARGVGALEARAAERRDAERAADARGVELMRAAGYDVSAARDATRRLAGDAASSGATAYLASHPSPAERIAALPAAGDGEAARDAFLDALDGLRFGFPGRLAAPAEGGRLVIPALGLSLRPPAGYAVADTSVALEFVSPEGDMRLTFRPVGLDGLALEPSLRAAIARGLAATPDIERRIDIARRRGDGPPAAVGVARFAIGPVDAETRIVLIEGDQRRFVLSAVYPIERRMAAEEALCLLETSLAPIPPRDRAVIDSLRIRVATAQAGETYAALTARLGAAPIGQRYFFFLNALDPQTRLRAGQRVKIVSPG